MVLKKFEILKLHGVFIEFFLLNDNPELFIPIHLANDEIRAILRDALIIKVAHVLRDAFKPELKCRSMIDFRLDYLDSSFKDFTDLLAYLQTNSLAIRIDLFSTFVNSLEVLNEDFLPVSLLHANALVLHSQDYNPL